MHTDMQRLIETLIVLSESQLVFACLYGFLTSNLKVFRSMGFYCVLFYWYKVDFSRPWSPPSNAINNPQLLGEKKDMEFFGLNDFVPQSPHNLPLRPMRLKYTSTKEFPSKTYGRLVPMPR